MTAIGKTIAEKILSAAAGRDARAGDVVVCDADWIIGTDASSPMAIDYFEKMGGTSVFDPSRIVFALDHYSPPTTEKTKAFHERVRDFAQRHGITVFDVGEGISHQIVVERRMVKPGDLVVGADSHTVTCGALNLFATGVGSSDLAAAMLTGKVWLRVPETITVTLTGQRASDLAAKDVALAVVGLLGAEGANYCAIEFGGSALMAFSLEERLVLCNLAVEAGAKTAICPADERTREYLDARVSEQGRPVRADDDARYVRSIQIDMGSLSPRVALPHSPDSVAPIERAVGTPVHMVFLGTCTGGRVSDFHEALGVLERGGGHLADGVQLVVTPASRDVERRLNEDGTLSRFADMGAIVTTPGCGACCGTSGVIPADGMNVLSTANRNFKARMGNATASIYLASPAACAAAALTGRISDPRDVTR
jgi:3-isopropylmalate/(R)-2-methylmalate dehydratase large subunit